METTMTQNAKHIADTSAHNTHSLWQRCLMVLTLLIAVTGVKAQPADGVYTLDNVNGRGAMSYGTYNGTEYFGLSEVTLNGYQSCSVTLSNDKDKYWYVATLNGVTYLYNIGKGTFVQKRQDETVTCAAYSNGGFTLESQNGNYSIKDGSHYLSYCCYWLPDAQLRWLSYEEAAALIDFNLVENGTTTYAKEIAAARAKLGFPTEDKYYIKCYTDQTLYLNPSTNNNNNNPHIIVSKTENYDLLTTNDLLWQLEHVGDGKYRIKHVSTGRYIYRNGTQGTNQSVQMSTTSNNNRNYFYFEVNASYPNAYAIEPVDCDGYSFNIWGGRQEGNTIGLYYHPDGGNSMWILERRKTPTPEITLGDEGYITITCSLNGATTYYTINGDAPTTASPQYNASNKPQVKDGDLVQAISLYADYEESDVASLVANMTTPIPGVTIDNNGNTSITVAMQNCTIYYTTNGEDPTESSTIYTTPFNVTNKTLVKAIAVRNHYKTSSVGSCYYVKDMVGLSGDGTEASPYEISTMDQWIAFAKTANDNSAKKYHARLTADISGYNITINNFSGTLDGQYHTISGLNAPLFATASDATIKNVMMDNVCISASNNAGAIASTASGTTRIYNCGVLATSESNICGNNNVGSIVGELQGNARVINCYSFANITGGNTVGGIVGYNAGSYVTGVPQTMVMNCAYYGNLNGGANRYPIFGGHNITNNQGDNTYNFFRHNESITYKGYNSAQAIFKDEYLDRFEFYRSILNSHRELAAYYAFNDVSNAGEIGKWTLDKSRAPYPIVTKHLSNTRKTLNRTIPNTQEDYAGKKIKDINVTININGTQVYNGTLPVTDMNTAEWDYTYGKIVLPFANEFIGWSIGNAEAITGWKVSTKDYYQDLNNVFDNKNYVYAQGGNYIVPEGVTTLTLTAYVAPAVYLSDASYDVVYGTQYNSAIARGGSTLTTYKGQTVYNTLSAAINALQLDDNSNLPHEQAIVLVGNYHYNQKIESGVLPQSTTSHFDNNKPFTLMSADKDNDQEPDYCFYQFHAHGSGRTMVHPVRFDFVASPGIGMASHVEGAAAVPNIGIWHGKGWFELTETYLGIMQECEIRPGYFLVNAPWIINGGIFEEINMSSTHEYENPNTQSDDHGLTYIRIGGNAYINNFYPGTQSKDATFTTPLKPICMSGGEVVSCYMTGKQPEKSVTSGSVNFFCNGGYIHEFLGAYLEPLAAEQDINIRADHALIDNFYGGGANENQVTPGNINITINNSQVGFFCGGPKFGNMTNGKKVTINATGTTFGEFYGGGYGGTALTRKEVQGVTIDFGGNDRTYGLIFDYNYKNNRLKYDANLGIAVNYSLQYFMYAGGGGRGVEKFNVDYARLSLAAVGGDITSNLKDCTILNNFYGGGCQGSVTGNITSTLDNCEIGGSAFAAGYTANATPCLVATKEQPTYSKFVLNLGYFTPFGEAYTEEFYWKAADADHEVGSTDDANKTLYTTEEKFTNMGQVTGNTSIVVKGDNSHIYGSVFGGGNASKVKGNTHVHILGGRIDGNVFGAGNQAEVTGKTEVVIGE